MSKILLQTIKIISSGLDGISLYKTRNYQRNISKISLADINRRWALVGNRLRNSLLKVVEDSR